MFTSAIDKAKGKYTDFAIIQIGRTSVNGYLIMQVGERISKTEVRNLTEYDTNIPALPLITAKKKLDEIVKSRA